MAKKPDEWMKVVTLTPEYRAFWIPCPTCGTPADIWCLDSDGEQIKNLGREDKMHAERFRVWELMGRPNLEGPVEPLLVAMIKAAHEEEES